jgi:hypothetical protein
MMSTYDLCKRFLDNFTNIFGNELLTITQHDTEFKSHEPISTSTSEHNNKSYRISTTPYKDALMKNLIRINFKNKNFVYYNNLGDKINQIVENKCCKRSYRYWWVEEYLRESYIRKNRLLQQRKYCVITRPRKGCKI